MASIGRGYISGSLASRAGSPGRPSSRRSRGSCERLLRHPSGSKRRRGPCGPCNGRWNNNYPAELGDVLNHLENRTMKITVETTVAAPLEEVWRAWTTPEDIKQWDAASHDWPTTAS